MSQKLLSRALWNWWSKSWNIWALSLWAFYLAYHPHHPPLGVCGTCLSARPIGVSPFHADLLSHFQPPAYDERGELPLQVAKWYSEGIGPPYEGEPLKRKQDGALLTLLVMTINNAFLFFISFHSFVLAPVQLTFYCTFYCTIFMRLHKTETSM